MQGSEVAVIGGVDARAAMHEARSPAWIPQCSTGKRDAFATTFGGTALRCTFGV